LGLFFSPFRWLWIVLGIVVLGVLAILAASVFFFFLGHIIFFGLGFLIFGVIIFVLIAGLFYRPYRRRMYYGWYGYDSAMNSLRQRYARGEITRDQFEQMASDLERHH
jgi:uncharacterized membrane protein